jgi:hypothetical protein
VFEIPSRRSRAGLNAQPQFRCPIEAGVTNGARAASALADLQNRRRPRRQPLQSANGEVSIERIGARQVPALERHRHHGGGRVGVARARQSRSLAGAGSAPGIRQSQVSRAIRSREGDRALPRRPAWTGAIAWSPIRSQVDRSLKAIVRAAAIAAIRRRRGWRLLSVERMLAAVDRTRARRARKRARQAPGHRASAPRWRHAPGSRWDTPARRTKASAAVSEAGLLLAVQPERPPLHVAGSARQVCLDPDLRAPSVISAPASRDRHREAADRSALSSSIGSTPRTVASPTFASTRGRKAFSQHSTGHREGGMPELIACRLQE